MIPPSSRRDRRKRVAALAFVVMLFGCLVLPRSASGTGRELKLDSGQVESYLPLNEPPPYDPWIHLAKLTESQGWGDGFGEVLAMSDDGSTIVAGVPERIIYHDDVGLVRIFTKPEDGEWQDAHEAATLTASDGTAIDRFGISVAISGDLIVVGKEYGTTLYVFARPAGGWRDMTETAKLRFVDSGFVASQGDSLAIMGDSILSGSSYYSNDTFPDGNSGAVFVWNKPVNGWTSTDSIDAILRRRGEDTPGSFGESMAASGSTLVVGGGLAGAYIFERPTGGWTDMTETAALRPGSMSQTSLFGGNFGASVAIDGNTVVVGAPLDDLFDHAAWEGSVYLYEKPLQGWVDMTEKAKLVAKNGTLANGLGIRFGHSVSISGNRVAVGAEDSFAAYVFHRPANGWVNMTETTLFPSDKLGIHRYQPTVAIRDDVLVVGVTDRLDVYRDQYKRPVMVIPGIYGSYFRVNLDHYIWNTHRGVHPDQVVIDPLTHAYDDLVQTLKNVGYVDGKDLFIVAYDWRLTPGPIDSIYDGRIDGLSGPSITDTQYQFGVDYLGYYLRKAVEAWDEHNPDEPLEQVDIISHSTGGLVARSYIQSGAYGDEFISTNQKTLTLPTVKNLIMVAVPNRGASQPWQAMENNFIIDYASKYVMSKILNVAYQKVLAGGTITGYPEDITLESISIGGTPDAREFINQYVPTFRSLLATYDFLYDSNGDLGNVNELEFVRNDLVLDLNNGLDVPNQPNPTDPSPFANRVEDTLVIYADSIDTEYRVRRRNDSEWNAVFRLDDYFESDVPAGATWYQGISDAVGDGTVPRESAVGQFIGDSRIARYRATKDNVTHTGMMSNYWVQAEILDMLEAEWELEDVSQNLAGKSVASIIWNAFIDPVDMVLVDGMGRRFGYTAASGPLTEIPNSVWFGGKEGIGWIFSRLTPPLRVELTGLGESYLVQLSGAQTDIRGGYVSSGFLSSGETISAPLDIELMKTHFMPVLLTTGEHIVPTATTTPATTPTHSPTPTSTPEPTRTPTPTVTPIQKTVTLPSIADATVIEGYAEANAGDTFDMWVGYDDQLDPDAKIVRGLVKFYLGNVPAGAVIETARLRVYYMGHWEFPNWVDTIRAYRVQGNWQELSVNWGNKPGFGPGYGSVDVVADENWGWRELDVTALAQGWVDGTYPNHGIMLRGEEGSGGESSWRSFYTREGDYPPELVLTYRSATNMVSSSSASQDAGSRPAIRIMEGLDTSSLHDDGSGRKYESAK